MTRSLTLLAGALLLLSILGCGNKGPLYLPQAAASGSAEATTDDAEQSRQTR